MLVSMNKAPPRLQVELERSYQLKIHLGLLPETWASEGKGGERRRRKGSKGL
jgi:hypothetical protein